MNVAANRIRRGRKYDQVVGGAREVFLQYGFEGASVDDIARAAGVSKATLYSYFPDKRLLFLEVAKVDCCQQAYDAVEEIDPTLPVRDVLAATATQMMCFLLSDIGRAVFRIVIAEAERFPELGREYWRNGPARARHMLIGYFRHAIARGELKIDDLDLAADQFIELCKVDLFPRLMLGVDTEFEAKDYDRIAQGAIEMFMARYGA
ncbi:TetR/AcrR family transcriptional regulator [Tropicimonas sediminicola]|uniref:Transcriptional regulator, TetR family n=1 Tax=Tropicimonas sediminicola TaxID=1031541 RepID=A0A239IMI4_9RHOB|nr:TetR/AcrR family transcriptional regulator [Tropicimonas sediminicola]SNS94428.1 transcriptional regulator, TetR family [Tropicimonas sediminicola]